MKSWQKFAKDLVSSHCVTDAPPPAFVLKLMPNINLLPIQGPEVIAVQRRKMPLLMGTVFVVTIILAITWYSIDLLNTQKKMEEKIAFQNLPIAPDREMLEPPSVVDEPAEVASENQPTPPAESVTPDETPSSEPNESLVSEPNDTIRSEEATPSTVESMTSDEAVPSEETPATTESTENTSSSQETAPSTTAPETPESSQESSTPSQESSEPSPSSSTPAEASPEPSPEPSTPTESTPTDSSSLPTVAQIIMAVDFENWSAGSYNETELKTDWPGLLWSNGIDDTADGQSRASVVSDQTHGQALSILFPSGGYGSQNSGALWEVALSSGYEELCISYDMKVEQAFDFVKGGKLPGLGGGTTPTGGEKPDGSDGFTVRGMFRESGQLESYVYHKDQPGNYGEDFNWSQESVSSMLDEQWHSTTTCLTMNDPASNNGQLQVWFDNTRVLHETDLAWRTVSTLSIDHVLIHVFMGGSDASWAPGQDQKIFFDNFQIFIPTFSL